MQINVTRTAVVRSRWAALAMAMLFATASSGCSTASGVTETSSSRGATTSTPEEATASTPDQTSTSTTEETTTPGALTTKAPIVAGDTTTLYYFDHVSNSPLATIGPLPEPDHFLLSPDGRYAAVEHSGDALRKARLEIVATDTGTSVVSVDVDSDGVTAWAWSPDSTAVLAAPRSGTTGSWVVYRIDGTSHSLAADAVCTDPRLAPLWVRGQSGDSVLQYRECGTGTPATVEDAVQLITSKGEPVSVLSYMDLGSIHLGPQGQAQYAGSTGRYDLASGQFIPFDGPFGNNFDHLLPCGRLATLKTSESTSGGQVTYGLYDSDSATITPVDVKVDSQHCPIASNKGTLVAFESTDGVRVVDLATGNQTPIAREGYPIAWSKDDSKVLVQGNGTFVIAADGSGGEAASIALQEFCRAGNTGTVITVAGEQSSFLPVDLLAYDIATDSAKSIGKGLLDSDVCEASSDGNLLVMGHTVIDLAGGRSAIVTAPLIAPLDAHLHLRGAAFVDSISHISV